MRESWNFRIPDAWKFLILNFGIMMAQYDEMQNLRILRDSGIYLLDHPVPTSGRYVNMLSTHSAFFCQPFGPALCWPFPTQPGISVPTTVAPAAIYT